MTAPLHIEFAGPPGSGKTSLASAAATNLRAMGYKALTAVESARPRAAESGVGRMIRSRSDSAAAELALWWLFYAAGVAYSLRFAWNHRGDLRGLLWNQVQRPIKGRLKGHIIWWYLQLGGRRDYLASSRSGGMVLTDDGFVHRSVALFSSPHERVDRQAVESYVRSIPAPAMIIRVLANVETCTNRVLERGVWAHSKEYSPEELRRYVANADEVLDIGIDEATRAGMPVIEIRNDDAPLETTASRLTDQLLAILAADPTEQTL
jgi:thymidylate kinase